MENYIFELLAIDKDGAASITREDSLVRALLFSEDLWIEAKEEKIDGVSRIYDKEQGVEVKYQIIDATSILNESISSAFTIKIKCDDFNVLEAFRNDFLVHLKSKLKFSNIRILKDDITSSFSVKLFPLINKLENLLRSFIIKFNTQKVGLDWWNATAPKHLIDKVNNRKKFDKTLNTYIDLDIDLIDFEDLGELIYKSASNVSNENILSKILEINTIEELDSLKKELQKSDVRGFKDIFIENNFEKNWKRLIEIRNKAFHNIYLTNDEFVEAQEIVNNLCTLIESVDSKIKDFNFTHEEKEALKKATSEKIVKEDYPPITDPSKMDIKVLGKIDLTDYDKKNAIKAMASNKIITVEELKKELEYSERIASLKGHKFISLKFFVTKILADKGFAIGPTYSIVNILRDQGEINIYDYEDGTQVFPVKAIKLANSSFDQNFNSIPIEQNENGEKSTETPKAIDPIEALKIEDNMFSSKPETFDFF